LWLIGQLAVLGPALRAAAVPPVVATRSDVLAGFVLLLAARARSDERVAAEFV
jgi:hypothetical protein